MRQSSSKYVDFLLWVLAFEKKAFRVSALAEGGKNLMKISYPSTWPLAQETTSIGGSVTSAEVTSLNGTRLFTSGAEKVTSL